jgi:hypothetical protein
MTASLPGAACGPDYRSADFVELVFRQPKRVGIETAEARIEHLPRGSLTVDAQLAKFSESELNVGKLRTDAEWWAHWESWCRHAVNRARNPHAD